MSHSLRCPLKPVRWRSGNVLMQLWLFAALLHASAGVLRSPGAVQTNLRLSEYQKQYWQVEDGLPENNVRMIAQQPGGPLLLATSSGLTTFDGLHFQGLSMPGDDTGETVNAVLVGRDGDLWIGTDGRGVLQYSGSGTPNNISELAGRMDERVRMLYQDSAGSLWIATQNGIERYRDGQLESFSDAGMISGDITAPFAEDSRGGIFFVTSNGLFHMASGGKPEPYRLHDTALGKPVAVYRDLQQRLWVGTANSVVQLIPRKTGAGYDEVVGARIQSPVTVFLGDAQGNLWVGTHHSGILRIGSDGVTSWSSRNGLPDDTIRSLYIDNEQNLWIGMFTGGLSRWRRAAFAPYGEAEGFPAAYAANVFADSHGDLWLGTWDKGLYRIHDGKLADMTPPGMPITTHIRAFAENQHGQLWIGTWFNGVYRYDGRAFRHYLLGTESPGNAVSSILVDRDGGLWIGTYTGLLYFAGGEPTGPRSVFLDAKLITCTLQDLDGSLLVGTSTGLFRVREGHSSPITDLPNSHVLSLTRDSQGYTWIGTKAGGLALLRNDHAESLPAKSGLPTLPVSTAIEDGEGYLWLGTSRGIVRVGVAALHAVAEKTEQYLSPILFGRADGMPSSECGGPSLPGAARTADGTLWFATIKGFAHTTSAIKGSVLVRPIVPTLGWAFTDDLAPENVHNGGRVEIQAGQSDVIFVFNAIHLSNPSQIEFRYRLDGYDTDWTTTHGRTARYKRLSPGKYTFEVQARNSGEAWSDSVVSVPVVQRAYFYQTWYFYLAVLLLAAALGVQFFRQRVHLVKGQIGVVIEERNRIARECHDTLMAGFAAISWQLEATAKIFRDGALVETPAAKSCDLARSMVAHCQAEARRIIWDLRDTGYMTNILSHALSRTLNAQEPGDSSVITFRVEGDEVPLAPAYVHHLVCIGQEAVSNAMRHAAPSHIAVHLRYEADALNLTIRDDGSGFRGDSSKVGHFGIPVMEERARKVGGILRLQSSLDEGTEVSVKVDFNSLQKVSRQQQQYIVPWIGI